MTHCDSMTYGGRPAGIVAGDYNGHLFLALVRYRETPGGFEWDGDWATREVDPEDEAALRALSDRSPEYPRVRFDPPPWLVAKYGPRLKARAEGDRLEDPAVAT